MPKNSCCCLSSINLSEFVNNPYTENSKFEFEEFVKAVRVGIRALDKLIDENYNRHPLEAQREISKKYRNIGLGVFGYATALMKLGIKYGSSECIRFTDSVFSQMFRNAVFESNRLAKENGVFPGYKDVVFDSRIMKCHFDNSEIEELKQYGLRNASLISVAPTGCQKRETLVATTNGIYRLDELVDVNGEKWQDKSDIDIIQESSVNPISKGYINGYAPTKKITLSNNLILEATYNHMYKVIRGEECRWCRADELKVGDIIPSRIGYYAKKEEYKLKTIVQQLYHNLSEIANLPTEMNPKLAFILGAYYANGSNHYRGRDKKFKSIRFSMNAKKTDDIAKLCNYIRDVFGIFPAKDTCSNGACIVVHINNANICRWIEVNGLKKNKSVNSNIPFAIRCSSVESMKSFFDGYYMCDGSKNGNNRYIDTANYEIAQEMVVLLRAIGKDSRIYIDTIRAGAKSKNPMYRVYIGGYKSLDYPKENLRYIEKEKKDILLNVKNILGDDFIFDTITSIEDSVNFTLDIEVKNEHYYLANGIISHNTLSSLLGVSGGCEPEYAISFTRRTVGMTNNEDKYYTVYCSAAKEYMEINKTNKLPEYFICSADIPWRDRVLVQATMQEHIDTAISSTVNLKNSATKEDVAGIYLEAWKAKLKGITIFRDGCKRLGILTTSSNPKKEEDASTKFNTIKPVSRKEMGVTHGDTYCKKCACGTLYVTVNRDDNGNIVEIFVHTSKGGICQANISALTRMASLSLRSGVLVDEVIDQLRAISCPACNVTKAKGKPIDGMSCPDIISRVLQSAYDKGREIKKTEKTTKQKKVVEEVKDEYKCPECGAKLAMSGGCRTCTECGWSKCE